MSQEFEEVSIPVPWGHVAGKWWGSKSVQPILAIHGWLDNAGVFDTLAPLMVQEGYSLLCIDLSGLGLSSHLPKGIQYTYWNYVHLLRRIVKYYKWSNISLLGHSLGGSISFIYAALYPNEVKRYVMLDIASPVLVSPAETIGEVGKNFDKNLQAETLSAKYGHSYDMMVDVLLQFYNGSITKKSAEILLKRGIVPDDNKSDKYRFTLDEKLKYVTAAEFSLDLIHEFASRIKCEVMYIRAKPGYPLKDLYYEDVIKKIVNAKKKQLCYVSGTHHFFLNDPLPTFNYIKDFYK